MQTAHANLQDSWACDAAFLKLWQQRHRSMLGKPCYGLGQLCKSFKKAASHICYLAGLHALLHASAQLDPCLTECYWGLVWYAAAAAIMGLHWA